MKRLACVSGLTGVLLLLLLSSSYATWAAPLVDPLRQTVPTRTPTSPARTPGPPTATRQTADEDTPTPYPPTATLAVDATATVAPTSAPSDTPVSPATVSDAATQQNND